MRHIRYGPQLLQRAIPGPSPRHGPVCDALRCVYCTMSASKVFPGLVAPARPPVAPLPCPGACDAAAELLHTGSPTHLLLVYANHEEQGRIAPVHDLVLPELKEGAL